jgi:hypothetical protein
MDLSFAEEIIRAERDNFEDLVQQGCSPVQASTIVQATAMFSMSTCTLKRAMGKDWLREFLRILLDDGEHEGSLQ